MIAAVPTWIVDVGTLCAVLVGLGAAARTTPVKWMWNRVVAAPFAAWLSMVLTAHTDPIREDIRNRMDTLDARVWTIEQAVHVNGGSSLRDAVDRIEATVNGDEDDVTGR